jgi:hypothetical protein
MPDFKSMPRNDLIVLGSGLLVFIVSLFFPWYGVKFTGAASALSGLGGASETTNAWHGLAAFGLILLLLALLVVAAQVFAGNALPEIPVGYSVIAAGLSVLGALFVIIKSFDLPSASGFPGLSVGLRWGGWVLLVLVVVQAAFSVIRALSSGESMPWQQSGSAGAPPVGGPPIGDPPVGGSPTI